MRVRVLLNDREVYSAPLEPLRASSTGKSVILAQSSDKIASPLDGFKRIGWSFTVYGTPQTA